MKQLLSTILILFFAFSVQAFALDFTVNLTTDEHDANANDNVCDVDLMTPGNQCSLRAAIEFTININFDKRILFNLPANSTITLTEANGGELFIKPSNTEIVGTGANNLTIDGGAGTNRIFYTDGATVTISGMTLTGGNGAGAKVSGYGGAICAQHGAVTLDSVQVRNNTAFFSGGGAMFSVGTHIIKNSTFSANSADYGGGITSGALGSANSLIIENSTISNNTARQLGGGIFNYVSGSMSLRSITITANTANNGGGLYSDAFNNVNFINTIIAGNNSTMNFPEIDNYSGHITSLGYNLIGDSPGDAANTGNPITYQSTDILDTNPLLGILQNNGGTTPTHALLSGSPAIDKGNNSNSPGATDQRGFARIINGIIDIGAFELEASACTYSLSQSSTNIPASGGAGSFTITTQNGCAFTSVSNNDFISIDSGATGTGTTQVNFFVQANTNGTARTGTITVGGQTFTVNQAAGKSRKRVRFI